MPLGTRIIDQCLLGLRVLYEVLTEAELPGRHGLLHGIRRHELGNGNQADIVSIAP